LPAVGPWAVLPAKTARRATACAVTVVASMETFSNEGSIQNSGFPWGPPVAQRPRFLNDIPPSICSPNGSCRWWIRTIVATACRRSQPSTGNSGTRSLDWVFVLNRVFDHRALVSMVRLGDAFGRRPVDVRCLAVLQRGIGSGAGHPKIELLTLPGLLPGWPRWGGPHGTPIAQPLGLEKPYASLKTGRYQGAYSGPRSGVWWRTTFGPIGGRLSTEHLDGQSLFLAPKRSARICCRAGLTRGLQNRGCQGQQIRNWRPDPAGCFFTIFVGPRPWLALGAGSAVRSSGAMPWRSGGLLGDSASLRLVLLLRPGRRQEWPASALDPSPCCVDPAVLARDATGPGPPRVTWRAGLSFLELTFLPSLSRGG